MQTWNALERKSFLVLTAHKLDKKLKKKTLLLADLLLPKEMALIKLEHHSKQQDLESWDNEPFS